MRASEDADRDDREAWVWRLRRGLDAGPLARAFAAALLWGVCIAAAPAEITTTVALGAGRVAATLPLADGRALVLGTVETLQGRYAALWRLNRDGAADTTFATTGLLVASGVPDSQGLSIQQTPDGMLHIAVQAGPAGASRLEVHRWMTGTDAPLRITSQPPPDDWEGPAVLTRRGAGWVWIDKSRPQAPPLRLVPTTRDSPWTSVAATRLVRPADADSVGAPHPADAELTAGHAIFSPLAGDGPPAAPPRALMHDEPAWTGTMLVAALIAALGGMLWWRRRR